MKKIERLNWIIMTLRQRGKMSASELSTYMEVSKRTIYRDMDALSQMQVPIISSEGLNGGYEVEPGYFLPTLRLTKREILILSMLLKFSEQLNMGDFTQNIGILRQKLLEICQGEGGETGLFKALERIEFDLALITPDDYVKGVFETVIHAFEDETQLVIDYYSPHRNEASERQVTPMGLFFADGCWYLSAYCHERTEKRTFRLDRIRQVALSSDKVDLDILAHYDACGFLAKEERLVMELDSRLYEVIRSDRAMEKAKAEHTNGGWTRISLNTNRIKYFERLALENVEQVTVKEPKSLVETLNCKFSMGAEKYFSKR